ncbi:MAG TPA: hypothetical protein VNW68_03585 [Candidatus Limnocylindria bacterium]|jgi:hypothetical protein|nr:hypothetical protein [Candidatus Limnocylindria bacterium]
MDTSGLRSSERTGATNGAETAQAAGADVGAAGGPTAAQLRRFIKSRAYVPLHELRRRFELNGDLDEVCQIDGPDGARIFVGLPPRESKFLADLARDGDIGLELSNDPRSPIVVGVYPIRPVSRG